MQPGRRAEVLGGLVGGHAVPVVDRERACAVGQPRGGIRAGVRDRVGVVVVAVEEHDPPEAHRRQPDRDVLDERHERRDPQVDDAGEAGVRVRQPVVDRRRDERAGPRRDPARDLDRDEDVGQERTMRTVLLGRAGRHDDGPVIAQERLDLGIGHLAQEHGRRFHGGLLHARDQAMVVVSSPIPSIQTVTTSPASRWRSGPSRPGQPDRRAGRDQVARPQGHVSAEERDHLGDREAHRGRRAVLDGDPVDRAAEAKVVGSSSSARDDPRPDRTEARHRLAEQPLVAVEPRVARRDVVDAGVAEDVGHGLGASTAGQSRR